MADYVKGINVRNLFRQLGSYVGLAPRGDYDIFEGYSVRGGERSPYTGKVFGPTYAPTYPSPANQPTPPPAEDISLAPPTGYGYTGGGGGAAAQVEPNNANIGDRVYNLNDPAQLQQYIIDIENKLNSDFEFYKQRENQATEEDIYEAEQEQQRALTQIERALAKLGETRSQYNKEYAQSIADLAEGFRQGTARRQMFYASIAPRVYQSSQGTSQEYAQGKYQEAQKRYEEQKAQALKDYAEAERDYQENRNLIRNQFNLYKTRRERQRDDAIAQRAREQQELLGQARAGTLNYSEGLRNAGVTSNAFRLENAFKERDLSGYRPSNVNLNDLAQYIRFQPVGMPASQTQGMTQGTTGMRSQVMATPEAGGPALINYLGYQPEEEDSSTIEAYKRGRALV